MGKLNGKVAVVTGASKGIGAGIAKSLGRDGATVVVNYASDKAGAERVAAEITKGGGKAVVLGASVTKPAEIEALFSEVKKQFGKVDILVNNAGVFGFSPLGQITEESYEWMFGTNVKGTIFASQAALPLFPSEGGSIINIGSVVSEITPPGASVYVGTKGAVDVITRVLSRELGGKKIRVNAVNPGFTVTEGSKAAGFAGTEIEKAYITQTPLGRAGEPADIGDVVSFLASDDSRWISGALLQAGGGIR